MSNIAPLSSISNSLDLIAKLIRVLEKAGTNSDHLAGPINDRDKRHNLVSYLRAGCPSWHSSEVGVIPRRFTVWKSLKIGGITKENLLRIDGVCVSDRAKEKILASVFMASTEVIILNLARVKIRDLGFVQCPRMVEVFACIRELGHGLCPFEVGQHLLIATVHTKPTNSFLWLAMDQFIDEDDYPDPFCLRPAVAGIADQSLGLRSEYIGSGNNLRLDDEVIFILN